MNAMADIRVPPHSIEAEQAVIGALLLNNDAIDRIGALKAQHFYREDHQAIFAEIVQCIEKGQPADVITVWEKLEARGGAFLAELLPYLNQIAQNTPSAANIARYSEIVTERALLRGLMHVTSKADEMARNPQGMTADQVLDRAMSMLSMLAERRARNEPKMISALLTEFVDATDKRATGLEAAMPTRIDSLDRVLNGGLRGGQLVIVAGRPSMGKTALAKQVGLNLAETYSVLMFSMEMSGEELVGRALANRGSIALSHLLGRIGADDAQAWQAVTHGCAQLEPLRFGIDETPAITLLELRMKAKAWKRRHGLDVIIVDYLGLMSGGDGDKRSEQIGSYSRGLKALAKELDIAVIALAQLNRKSEDRSDRKPILSDLRDSGEIEQDADIVAFVHRPEMHNPNNSQLRGYAELLIRKQRNGQLADVPLMFEGAICRFSEWEGDKPIAATFQTTHRSRGFDE
jgi:replicative DNA helicase